MKGLVANTVALAVVATVAGGYFWLRAGATPTEPEHATTRVQRQTLERTVSATGVIRPMVGAEIDVGSQVSGIVTKIPVRVGETVRRGALLARIDPTELEAQLAEAQADLILAEAELGLAETTYARLSRLAPDGAVSATELDGAARDLEVARARIALQKARVNSATIRLGYTEVRAPIGGVIAQVTTREGETVAASFAAPTFVTIVDLARLEVQAYVDETDIGRIFVGQPAKFTVDTYPAAEFIAEVTAINPKAELQSGVVDYVVLLRFEGQDGFVLRPEMTAHVALEVESRPDVLTLPRKAVRREGGRQLVLVRRNDEWVDQEIQAGWRTDDLVEIVVGLTDHETVQLNQE